MSEKVIVLGASNKPERYSYKAIHLLKEHGHKVYPVHPSIPEVLGIKCYPFLPLDQVPFDTLTLYVNKDISNTLIDDIIRLAPRRVIFNPGSENPLLEESLKGANISYEHACTLVLLHTGQY